jgi:hypothetical protein
MLSEDACESVALLSGASDLRSIDQLKSIPAQAKRRPLSSPCGHLADYAVFEATPEKPGKPTAIRRLEIQRRARADFVHEPKWRMAMRLNPTLCCGFAFLTMIGISATAADARRIHQHSHRAPYYGAYDAYYGDYDGAYAAYGNSAGGNSMYGANRAPYAPDGETPLDFQLQGR